MIDKVVQELKQGSMVFPKVLFDYYHELNIDNQEFIFLIYLLNNSCRLDATIMSNDLKIDVPEFMKMMDDLISKGLISIVLKGKKEEWINIDALYKKLALYLISETKEEKTDLYSLFEQEFGRALSPMEYELINGWLANGSKEETIILALKEAVYNGVFKFKYIDSILYNWGKKGIKTKEDILKERKNYQKNVKNTELFDYDWLNEND